MCKFTFIEMNSPIVIYSDEEEVLQKPKVFTPTKAKTKRAVFTIRVSESYQNGFLRLVYTHARFLYV